MTTPEKYTQLRDALVQSDEYIGLPDDVRANCKRFVSLDAKANETAYDAALREALDLISSGKLTPSPDHPFPTRSSPGPDVTSNSNRDNEAESSAPISDDLVETTEQAIPNCDVVTPEVDAITTNVPAKAPAKAKSTPPTLTRDIHYSTSSMSESLRQRREVRSDATDQSDVDAELDIPDHIGFDPHGLLRVRVADIKPNPVNETVFTSSLGEESIRALAEDIRKRKLQNPIQVTPDMVTPDGERRRRALIMLGIAETYVRVVHGIDTPEQIEGYIWDSYSSGRDAALDERVKLYKLAQKVLQRRHGRPKGRPSKKSSSNDDIFWDADQVKSEAAKKAGFGSHVIADRSVSVFERGDADLVAKVTAGEVTISAAYSKLAKPKPATKGKSKKKATTDAGADKPADTATTDDSKPDAEGDCASTSTTATDAPTTPPTDSAGTDEGSTSSTTGEEDGSSATRTDTATSPETHGTASPVTAPATAEDGAATEDAEDTADSDDHGGDDAEQAVVTYEVARAVVWDTLKAKRDLAEDELLSLASHVEIDIILTANLDELWQLLKGAVENLEPTAADEWLGQVIQEVEDMRRGNAGKSTPKPKVGGIFPHDLGV